MCLCVYFKVNAKLTENLIASLHVAYVPGLILFNNIIALKRHPFNKINGPKMKIV